MTAMTELTGSVRIRSDETDPDPRWQSLWDSYCDYERRYKHMARWRVLAYAVLIYSLINVVFLLDSTSHYHNFWFVCSIIGIAVATPLAVYVQLALRKVVRERKAVLHQLFDAGLRVDEESRLLTNTAHPKVVARIKGISTVQ